MPDFIPFEIIEGDYDGGMVLLADHAMNRLPPSYGSLGLPESAFRRHIAFDIGVEALTRQLAARLNVPAVLGCFSRLLIDPNRGEDDPTLIMKISDGAVIPGNYPISDEESQRRLDTYHRPYHRAVERTLAKAGASGRAPLVLSLHSFTPAWKGVPRPWHAALLSPHALLEVRQDLIADEPGIAEWADRLAPIFSRLNEDASLHEYRVFPSRTGPYPGQDAPSEHA